MGDRWGHRHIQPERLPTPSTLVPRTLGSRPWPSVTSGPAGNRIRHGSDRRAKHGHEAECPGVATNRGQARAVTVSVLVVDDEPEVEMLFREQFRREAREGAYTRDFVLSALAALAILGRRHWRGDHPAGLRHQNAGHEPADCEDTSSRPAGVHDLGLWRRGYRGHGAGARG